MYGVQIIDGIKPKECNMKFAQLNGLQISEDQIKDLQKQIEEQRYKPKAIGAGVRNGDLNTAWVAEHGGLNSPGRFTFSTDERRIYTLTRQGCQDLIKFMQDCIEDIDNGVCG